jgi:hypothetical protein
VAVESLQWSSSKPYERGYTHRVGTAVVALDSAHPANEAIIDLDLAQRDHDGLVRFQTDVVLLEAPRRGGLLHAVANRGMVTAVPYSIGGPPVAEATGRVDPGDAWLLDRGYSVLWVGWQWDVERRPGAVGLEAPEALGPDGRPVAGQARLGFQPVSAVRQRRLADEVLPQLGRFRALPAASLNDPAALLTWRTWFNGPRTPIDPDRWRFADDEHIELDGGFEPLIHYELTYTTRSCPVTGAGLAAVRDVVSHLRPGYSHVLATGASQSGRWLRQFVYDTGNASESGGAVFDGVHCHIAGGRRGEFNHRYAQPSTMTSLGFSHLPPFSPTDGLFDRADRLGTVPKVLSTNTATEYWRGDASLAHPSPDGPHWRFYLYSGTHHAGLLPGYVEMLPVQLAGNLVDFSPLTRAHFVALHEWVVDGREPPPSAVPRIEDGSGRSREAVLEDLAGTAGFSTLTLPDSRALPGMPPIDLGPQSDRGVGMFPPAVTGPPRPCLVSVVDGDGNEVAGVRLPAVAVPLGVSVGWNPERPRPGVPVELWNLVGGRLPFAPDEILRRYGDLGNYLDLVRASVDALVEQRHLLPADRDAVMAAAAHSWATAVAETP